LAAKTYSGKGASELIDVLEKNKADRSAPRSVASLDYNPICASMGGHLSFHGAAAS
jgi:hypothetical protein